ncbi:MAG TPA: YggS family pyridoxal phosphate-dependent enzyme [Pirellulaceae bacterium]|nr:YggS family pyridoxal phosphate-dependent enzyme [Pirellulaceae bacterium]
MPLSESEIVARLKDNVARVRERMAAAAARAGREPHEILLVGVTKYVNTDLMRLLVEETGVNHLGESRPQDLWRKVESLGGMQIAWHLIGHLQRNKVRRTLAACWGVVIHSVDSLRLLEEINREASEIGRPADVLLEVNISGDANKHGFAPDEMTATLASIAAMQNVCVLGLMTMASLEGGADQARRDFAALRNLLDCLRPHCPEQIVLDQLSMGMSGDYEIAIEEGATMVRVGSALFEGIV